MPSLRLVLRNGADSGTEEAAPLPLVFDNDDTDETWGNERKGKRRRAIIDTSSEDESEAASTPPATVKGKGRAARPSASRLSSVFGADESGDVSMDGEDPDAIVRPGPSRAAPAMPAAPTSKRDHRTVEGRTFFIEDEELRLEDDVVGDTKIDSKGNMLGGRGFSTATFTSPHRADVEKQYILAIDACRAVGFRDSVLFFKRNPLLFKLSVLQQEKDDLIAEGRLHPNLRHRAVSMIAARNFYKIFGARVVVGGHYVKDDYYEEAARLSGFKEDQQALVELYDPEIDTGTLAFAKRPEQRHTKTGFGGDVPRTRPPKQGAATNKTLQSIAPSAPLPRDQKYGGSGMQPFEKYDPNSKARRPAAGLTPENWTYQYARAVTRANREIHKWREGYAVALPLNETVEQQVSAAAAANAATEAEEANTEVNGTGLQRRRARSPTRGILDLHTAVPHVRQELQPSRAKLEMVGEVPDVRDATPAMAREGFASFVHELGLPTAERSIEPAFTVPDVWHFRNENVISA